MTKLKLKYAFFIFSLSLLFYNTFSSNSMANPLPIETSEIGGIIPSDLTSCSMINASVTLEIDATNLLNNVTFSFRGSYTLYNPGETTNLTIAAPFAEMTFRENSTCIIKINNSVIPFSVKCFRPYGLDKDDPDLDGLWGIYLLQNYFVNTTFLICNVTIPTNTSIILEYAFDTNKTINLNNLTELKIYYYVGTSRYWKGVTTESVEFKVLGKTPDDFYNNNCTVSELPDGPNYLWEWKNEIIYDAYVFILYEGNYTFILFPIISFGNSFLFITIMCLLSLIYIIKLNRSKQILVKKQKS